MNDKFIDTECILFKIFYWSAEDNPDINKIWPLDQAIDDVFWGYCSDLFSELAQISQTIQDLLKPTENSFNKVHRHLKKFKEQTTVDEQFVRLVYILIIVILLILHRLYCNV